MDHYFNKKYLLLLLILIAIGNVIRGMELPLQENSNNSLIPQLTYEMWIPILTLVLTHQEQYNKPRIKLLLSWSIINKDFYTLTFFKELWTAIFIQSRQPSHLLTRIAQSSLQPSSNTGIFLNNSFIENPIVPVVREIRKLTKVISLDPEKYPWYKDEGKRDEQWLALSLFFRGCCFSKRAIYQLDESFNTEHIGKWAELFIKTIVSSPHNTQKNISIKKRVYHNLTDPAIILSHWLITYCTQFKKNTDNKIQNETIDEFEQDALIRACRLRDARQIKELINKNSDYYKNQIIQKDILNYSALRIVIINHDYESMDALLSYSGLPVKAKPKDIDQLVILAIEHSNNYALQNLLNHFYAPISSFEYYMPLSRSSKKFLEIAIFRAARVNSDNTKALEILFSHGVSPTIECPFAKKLGSTLSLANKASSGDQAKVNYIENYKKEKSGF